MDNKKFDQLINYIINENTEKARELFHDIVVEKSREIYESIMDEEDQLGGDVGELMDEIGAEEVGMNEEDDEEGFGDDEEFGVEDEGDDFGSENPVTFEPDAESDTDDDANEDTLVRIEDKLDQLMDELEQKMFGNSDDEGDSDLEADDDEGDVDLEADDEEGDADLEADEEDESEPVDEAFNMRGQQYNRGAGKDEGYKSGGKLSKEEIAQRERARDARWAAAAKDRADIEAKWKKPTDQVSEEEVMEAVQLKQVGGSTYDKFGKMGDKGAQPKSPSLSNSGQAGMGSRPVKFAGQAESVPTSPKAPSNYGTKGQTTVKNAGQFKNAPAQRDSDLENAPKPVKTQSSGVNNTSVVAESKRKAAKKVVK